MNAKLFLSNKSQAVRLPKAVAFPEGVSEVTIVSLGNSRLITPSETSWDDFFEPDERYAVTDDFMNDNDTNENRDQPRPQQREAL
ncbi:type II toxin-antitoxin system VapB family antitoxin [Salinicola rhizosphaerae]|uniref:Antitoxin VapB n=1 Tax=Salinicola rhizosphaerae TaxID=1443141 RepID=A0ABQ3DZQ9_9GAMM|nr:type II toxin-antitoxin system VapB family antitoxin [Salinicola rhizosphaerae]GHB20971.1 antitoxin VapB [Salinicola rhizosphaerae]